MTTIDLTNTVIFEKSIIISKSENTVEQDNTGSAGQLRFNQTTFKFEGYHCYPNSNNGADIFGNRWRSLTQDVASANNLGIVRVGQNLRINPNTGILSAIASGSGRSSQLVITVSPIEGAADYLTINEAITDAIGTPPNYTNGSITSLIDSAPSPIYPFIIQLGPGQYSELTNHIVLPNYVSLIGEGNYTSVITQNAGNSDFITACLITLGENSEIKNLSLTLADSASSNISIAIGSFDKSNVLIDNCIINCSNNINTVLNTQGIILSGGSKNRISNNIINFNSSILQAELFAIHIINSTPEIINNTIDILTPHTNTSYGMYIQTCIGTNSIMDKLYIENLKLSNNFYNVQDITNINNIGIFIIGSSIIIKNSDIEVSNNSILEKYCGIYLKSNQTNNPSPYNGKTTTNIISFINITSGVNKGTNTINSSNLSSLNFITENYEREQYICVTGSLLNDGIYKIASITNSSITLENGFNLNNENASSNIITLKGLYDINIYNSKINGTTNSILNSDLSNDYVFNLHNVITDGGAADIDPSFIFYTHYKTITVGKVGCDFNSLFNAMNSMNDNSTNNRYIINIQSGIYHETNYITCKEYVDINGMGNDNTILQFYQADNTAGIIPTSNSSCLILCSNMSIKNLAIKNSSTNYIVGNTASTVLYNAISSTSPPPAPSITNITLENITINSNCSSVYNTGIYLQNSTNIILRNIDINIFSNKTSINNIGIQCKNSNDLSLYNITTTITSNQTTNNYSIYLQDSECNIYNPNLLTHSSQMNAGIYTLNSNNNQKLVQIYNGQIRSYDNVEYSIFADNYYTILCNSSQLLGDTFKNNTSSHISCNSCYTFNNQNDKYNIQSLNSRGQNEQILGTVSLGDTAGKRDSTGINNVFIGINSGSNVTTASYNTFVGANTGKNTNNGNNNTLIGSNVGQKLTNGIRNTILGSNAGITIVSGSNNVLNGYNSGYSLTTGNDNVLLGTSSGNTLNTGNLNVFIGKDSGLNTNISNKNTFLGSYSGISNKTGSNNTYIGVNTGNSAISGSNNILIGKESGYNNLASNIVAIGTQSGYNNDDSIKNTYIGHNSGQNNSTGVCNTYIGHKSAYSNLATPASASFNVVIGNEAGYSLTSGARNILIGSTKNSNGLSNDSAGWALRSGVDNIHIGANSGSQSISSSNNVLIGSDVGTSISTASNNVLIGKNTGNSINTNSNNIIIGAGSGNNNNIGNALIIGQNAGVNYTSNIAFAIGHNSATNVSGMFNMYIGQNSGGYPFGSKSGSNNLAIGPYSGYFLSSGNRNIMIGSGNASNSVGKNITSGNDNTLLGFQAGQGIQQGSNNTLLGSQSGYSLTTGSQNLILGYQSAYNLATGSNNVSLGSQAGYNLSIGAGNIFSGYQAGYNTRSGSNNINIGVQAGYTGQATINNIHIGYQAGYYSNGSGNLFMGVNSGSQNTLGYNNIFLGSNSGAGYNTAQKQIGNNNMFMGTNSGKKNYNGTNNIFLGLNSGTNNVGGSKNIFIGENTGAKTNLSHNIFIGTTSLDTNGEGIGYKSISSGPAGQGERNLFIGHDVGIQNTTGQGNIFLGDSAGKNNTSGDENIYIGSKAGMNGSNQNTTLIANYNIAVGYNAGINNSFGQENILIGKNVAELTVPGNSYYQNIIIGSEAGKNINQNNQIFIGTNAGQSNTTGDRNIFIGLNAGKANVTSPDNVVIGSNAGISLMGNLVGNNLVGDNVLIGAQSGKDLSTGTNNIYVGSGAGTNATTSINNVVIGANAMNQGNANNVIIIGNNAGKNNNVDANIFIGSNAGVNNNTGQGNIFVGYESGYNVNSNGNIIFGNQTISSGKIADNNIVLGNQTAQNVVNKSNFVNNIVMGASAGKASSLSISSIIVGANALNIGTGGDVNIIMGNNTANNLGNPNLYYANTLTQITTAQNSVYINVYFGTGAYYFKVNDYIIIESLNNNYVFQTQISSILPGTGANLNKTQLIFINKPTNTIPIGSLLYSKNVKSEAVGNSDYSKSSSNMCLGDHSGYELTTGSKNSSIGDNSMYNNKVGNYNIVFGTESGYNLNTNNNLCLGIKAGYSIDKFKNTQVVQDFTFNSNTNTIVSKILNFDNYYYGTKIEIEGSSSNDNRYFIDYTSNITGNNTIKVLGYPNIIEDQIPVNIPEDYTIGASEYAYTNYTYTSNTVSILKLTPGYAEIEPYSSIYIYEEDTATLNNIFNIIKNCSHVTIKNSLFNNGLKIINLYDNEGQITIFEDITGAGVKTYIRIPTIQNLHLENSSYSTIITLEFNNIAYLLNSTGNTFNNGGFANDKIFIKYGANKNSYIVDNRTQNYVQKQLILNGNINQEVSVSIKGIVVNKNVNNNIDIFNQVFVKGGVYNGNIINFTKLALHKESGSFGEPNYIYFNSKFNTIENIRFFGFGQETAGTYPSFGIFYITGTQYNNGYFFFTKIVSTSEVRLTIYIDNNYKITDETIDVDIECISFKLVKINQLFTIDSQYTGSPSFNGSVINVKYRNNAYKNFILGTYIIDQYNKGCLQLSSDLLALNTNTTTTTDIIITTSDLGINIKNQNDYVSGYDLIFQTSNITCSNIEFDSINSLIRTDIEFGFIDIVAPVLIKIENTLNNNKFLLVKENLRPFDKLIIDQSINIINDETIPTCQLKMNSISSYRNLIDLSYMQVNKEYLIYGMNKNNNISVKLYDTANVCANAVYLSDDSYIVNDTFNNMYNSITYTQSRPIIKQTFYFDNQIFSNVDIIIMDSTNIKMTLPTNNMFDNDKYIKISNSNIATYDGLYLITNTQILVQPDVVKYTISTHFERNGIVYDADPFPLPNEGIFQATLISNQFNCSNYNFQSLINSFGENAKYLSFTIQDTSFATLSHNNSLTFEIESYKLNASTSSVYLLETCPESIRNTNPYGFDYINNNILIDFGEPNPSNRVSDIYRTKKRPLLYSGSDIIQKKDGAKLYINYSLSTIRLPVNDYEKRYELPYVPIIDRYGKTYINTFNVFRPGEIIYIKQTLPNPPVGPPITDFRDNYFLIKSITSDGNKITFDPNFTKYPSIDTYPYTGGNIPFLATSITSKHTICDENIDFTQFDFDYIKANPDYNFLYKKLPFSYINSNTITGNYDLLIDFNDIYHGDSINSNINTQVSYLTSNVASNLTVNLLEFAIENTIIVDKDNVNLNYTNMFFHNLQVNSNPNADISFYTSNNTITSTTTNLSGFLKSEYILISNTILNNGLYRINDLTSPTNRKIIISSDYNLINEQNKNAIIKANNINTSNSSITDLSVFYGKQNLIVTQTDNNNTNYISHINSNSKYSIYIDSKNVVNETPIYCDIEKSIIIDEKSTIASTQFNFNNTNNINTITTTDALANLSLLRTNQSLKISNSTNNNAIVTISDTIIPSNASITVNEHINTSLNATATLTKNINFNIIGEPIKYTITGANTNFYHYEDAQGNNCMIGSLAGQFIGELNNAIYNVAIGSRCAQINHGSGNIFIGNESKSALSASETGATTYTNKYAVYKTNNIGIPSTPLIGGDFNSGIVGINTITPESFNTASDVTTTATKLVVNGGAIANTFAPFTGCHLIYFANSNIANIIQVGMLVSSSGFVSKTSIVNTVCTVDLSKVKNDKTVFGVYAYSDETKSTKDNEYTFDDKNNIVNNPAYNNDMTILYYVASLGEGCILISNYSGDIQNGDYITTCQIPGYGCLQDDDILHSYTVAKCTENINWSSIKATLEYNGNMYKVFLAGCTYHCG